MRYREEFTLFRRTVPSGKIVYYYTVYDEKGQRRQFSTGENTKAKALKRCLFLYKHQRLFPGKESLIFRDYTRKWFIYDECPYIQAKLRRNHTYSRSYANSLRARLERHIWPLFGNIQMDKIKPDHIEYWIQKLKVEKLSNRTINHYLKQLKLIFNEAERLNHIDINPSKPIGLLGIEKQEKGIFTINEVDKLFLLNDLKRVWNGQMTHYLINRLAFETGARLGEIMALKRKYIYLDHILIKHSWDRKYGLKSTKNGKERKVPISNELYKLLSRIPVLQEDHFVFSVNDGLQPVDHKAIYKWMKRAFQAIGISEKERLERKLSFHSYRHLKNSQMIAEGYSDSRVRLILGHMSQEMTDNYAHSL